LHRARYPTLCSSSLLNRVCPQRQATSTMAIGGLRACRGLWTAELDLEAKIDQAVMLGIRQNRLVLGGPLTDLSHFPTSKILHCYDAHDRVDAFLFPPRCRKRCNSRHSCMNRCARARKHDGRCQCLQHVEMPQGNSGSCGPMLFPLPDYTSRCRYGSPPAGFVFGRFESQDRGLLHVHTMAYMFMTN
jgi:hypothetical protein